MSAVAGLQSPRLRTLRPRAPALAASPRLALLGTGTVGAAWVERYTRLQGAGIELPALAWLANSRAVQPAAGDLATMLEQANAAPRRERALQGWAEAEALQAGDILVDATASDTVAGWHPEWLARGVHVVTANKLGHGSLLARSQAIAQAQVHGRARYGDSATVGAGLPVLSSLRALVAGGDRIHAVEGVLSGSLAWLLGAYDGARPFSALVREAAAAGYTEPDPRIDLSGEDVRRKLLILSRAAGHALEADAVQVDSLVPEALAALAAGDVDGALPSPDAPLRERYAAAYKNGENLRFIARLQADGLATVGLEALAADHPLAGGAGTDNRVAIWSDRYRDRKSVV